MAMASKTPKLEEPAGDEASAASAWHMGRSFPLKVGALQIDEQGRIRPRDSTVPIHLNFAYRGVAYHAEVETAFKPRVRLTAELGKLPYTMEIGAGRYLIRRILNASAGQNHGCISLSEDHDILLEAVSIPPNPFIPASLMATLTALLLDFQPYLELLGQVLNSSLRAKTAETQH